MFTKYCALLLLSLVTLVSCRTFSNPVINNLNTPDPGALKYDGKYYVVTTTNDEEPDKFPIHVSSDLQKWELVGYVLNESNYPIFSHWDQATWAPELHRVGDKFFVYFTAYHLKKQSLVITAAVASNITGPYESLTEEIAYDPTQGLWDGTLFTDTDGQLYLLWAGGNGLHIQPMNPDGITFTEGSTSSIILVKEFIWEDGLVEAPWIVKKNNTYYLFYSGSRAGLCTYAVGIAKSESPLGPYEKRGDPILVENDDFKATGHCSVVQDLEDDDENYVIVYHSYLANHACDGSFRYMMASSLRWEDDGWPHILPQVKDFLN